MKKRKVLPLILIVAAFIVTPISFWFFSQRADTNVKGAKTQRKDFVGIVANIDSNFGTWDLYEYACKTKEFCLESLYSGDRVRTLSGGTAKGYEVYIENNDKLNEYEYLKIFVKSGWGAGARPFEVDNISGSSTSTSHDITYEGVIYQVLIVPLDEIRTGILETVHFTD